MSLLLDTHVFLWWLVAPERLNEGSFKHISDPANDVFLSAASVWEMAIKARLGRLDLPEPCSEYLPRVMRESGFEPLPIHHHHAAMVENLPLIHRDPFDRLLVVQAQLGKLVLVTADSHVLRYDVETFDASGRGPGSVG